MNGSVLKVLLVQAPPWGVSTFPLGIAYLSQYLRSKGMCVQAWDLNIEIFHSVSEPLRERWHTGDFEFWASGHVLKNDEIDIDSYVNKILAYDADVIGFSATFAGIPFLNCVLEKIKKINPKKILIVGGAAPFQPFHRGYFTKNIVDYFILGEGELVLYELLGELQNGVSAYLEQQCVCWKDNPDDVTTCIRVLTPPDVHALPFPTFEDFNADLYVEKDLLPIIASRGCINACAFCCDWPLKRPYRTRYPKAVVEEIKYLINRYNRRRFEFSDLLINGNLDFLNEFCDILIEEKLNIAWGGQAAVRAHMSPDLFRKLRAAGCGGLTFGFESFSDALLEKMGKRFTADGAAFVIRMTKEAGMLVEGNLLVGFPGETEEDIDATIAFLKENRRYVDKINSLNICSVGPGMALYEQAGDFGLDKGTMNDLYAWHSADYSNTLEIRLRRHAKVKKFIEDEGLMLCWENVRKDEGVSMEYTFHADKVDKPRKIFDPEKYDIAVPDSCVFLLTLSCSLHCKMCHLWDNKEDDMEKPSREQWQTCIDSLDQFGKKPFTIIFGGGEPLLCKNLLLPLITYASGKGMRTSLATSGYFMNETVARDLAQSGLHYIALTLYSLRSKDQDFLRGVKGSLQKVKQSVEMLSKFNPKLEIAIDTVLMEPTMRRIIPLTKWVKSKKEISRIFFQAVQQPFHTKPMPQWYLMDEYKFLWPRKVKNMIKVIDKLIEMKKKELADRKEVISNSLSQFEVFKQYFSEPERFIKKEICPVFNSGNFVVTPDGSVRLCPYMKPIGNIRFNTVQEIWYSETAHKRREEILNCVRNCHHIVNCWFEEEVNSECECAGGISS